MLTVCFLEINMLLAVCSWRALRNTEKASGRRCRPSYCRARRRPRSPATTRSTASGWSRGCATGAGGLAYTTSPRCRRRPHSRRRRVSRGTERSRIWNRSGGHESKGSDELVGAGEELEFPGFDDLAALFTYRNSLRSIHAWRPR
jgi:hypothetical protein